MLSRLTSSAQRHHTSLPKPKDDNISGSIATLVNQHFLDKHPKQLRALLQPRIGVKPPSGGVEDNVISPMRSLEIEKRFGTTDRHAHGLRKIHLLAEIGKRIVPVAETMQKDQDVGRRVIFGRCVDIISISCGKSDNNRMVSGIAALVRVDPWTLKAGVQT